MESTPPPLPSEFLFSLMQPPLPQQPPLPMQPPLPTSLSKQQTENANYKKYETNKRSRSRSRDQGRDYDKEREKDKNRKKRDRSSERESERNKKSKEREHERGSKDRDRRRERNRDQEYNASSHRRKDCNKDVDRERDRGRLQRSRSRTYDDFDGHRRRRSGSRSHRRDRERSRSRSYDRKKRDRNSRDRERDRTSKGRRRSSSMERDRKLRLLPIKEESRESRLDLTQTIQELMNCTTSTRNFASLFNCTNSNDSCSNDISENSQDGIEKRRRKKSRWGGTENDKTFIPGMPTILPSTLDPTQQEAYLVQLQIEEISRKLRTGDLGIPQNPEERSPSPEPIYSSDGKRLNTREFRFRKRLEEQRHQLIQKMQSVNPEFKPPADYKPPVTRVSDKVLIPQEEHPDINFVGLLIGPRGNTLKAMEKETGAKIIIRGKGSVKEGKVGRKDGQPLPGEDEPLHAFITAPNPEAVKKAVDKIKDVIRQGIEVPEGHNDLRRMQLRELAQLNGTLRETDVARCTNCDSTEHKSWLCPDKPNITRSIICTSCGGAGHISKDCHSKRPGANGEDPVEADSQAKIDEEYLSLMAELGEGPPPVQPKPAVDPLAQVHLNRGYSLFDKKPNQMQAIQPPPAPQSIAATPLGNLHAVPPPPPIPPAWGALIQPPGAPQPPLPAPPPLPGTGPVPNYNPPWMGATQPPPPGGELMNPPIPGTSLAPPPPPGTTSLQPPGTGPGPSFNPPPPGTWGYGGWLPPPPPGLAPPLPPCAPPPPGIPTSHQPPPPPPPSI